MSFRFHSSKPETWSSHVILFFSISFSPLSPSLTLLLLSPSLSPSLTLRSFSLVFPSPSLPIQTFSFCLPSTLLNVLTVLPFYFSYSFRPFSLFSTLPSLLILLFSLVFPPPSLTLRTSTRYNLLLFFFSYFSPFLPGAFPSHLLLFFPS